MTTYLNNCDAHKFRGCSQSIVCTCHDCEHKSTCYEALNLDPPAAQFLHKVNGEEITGHITRNGYDEISDRVLHQNVVFVPPCGKADLGENYGLIEIEICVVRKILLVTINNLDEKYKKLRRVSAWNTKMRLSMPLWYMTAMP